MNSEASSDFDLSVILIHDGMVDKHGKSVTTSLTLNDMQDLARSCRTFGVRNLFIAHPSPSMLRLARRLQSHWDTGFGSTYNPKRKMAFEPVKLVSDIDEAIMHIDLRAKKIPKLIATSARHGDGVCSYESLTKMMHEDSSTPYMLMLGTGWGMGPELMSRADLRLAPVLGVGEFNHLSVRSACAIMLDRLAGH